MRLHNADVRTSVIVVLKLKQAIEMAEAVQQVHVKSSLKKARKSYSREEKLNLSDLGTPNSGILHLVDGPAFNT